MNIYQEFAVKYSADQRAPGSLYNAALLYKGLNNKDKAISLLDRFVKFYPKHKIAGDAYMELAEVYDGKGKFQSARNTYREFAARSPVPAVGYDVSGSFYVSRLISLCMGIRASWWSLFTITLPYGPERTNSIPLISNMH